jgi:hypothetical protein
MWCGQTLVLTYRHIVIDVMVTSARTNNSVPHIGARLTLPGNLALGDWEFIMANSMPTSALPLDLTRLQFY